MRAIKISLFSGTLLLLAAGLAWAEKPTREQLQAAAKKAGTVNGLCPVKRQVVTSAAGTATYKGETRYGRRASGGLLSGRDPAVLPGCGQ